MMFMKKDHRPEPLPGMLYGTYEVWHVSSEPNPFQPTQRIFPNPYENQPHIGSNPNPYQQSPYIFHNSYENQNRRPPNPHQILFDMFSMVQEIWQHREPTPHWGSHGRRTWKHGFGRHERNPSKFQEMFKKMHEKQEEDSDSSSPAPRRHGGWKNSSNSHKSSIFWFCWKILRRLPQIWELLQMWRYSYLNWLSWRMTMPRPPGCWECLENWRYLNWMSSSGSEMVTSPATLSSEIPPCLAALLVCRMLAASINTCSWCFYSLGA